MATPLAALRPPACVPPRVLPADEVTVMEALLPVTTLPAESSTLTTGWVASRAPLGPPTGCGGDGQLVGGAHRDRDAGRGRRGDPGRGVGQRVTGTGGAGQGEVAEGGDAARGVEAAGLPPPIVLPADEVTVMEALLVVTRLPWASWTWITGWVASRAALGPPTGAVVTANLLAAPAVTLTPVEVAGKAGRGEGQRVPVPAVPASVRLLKVATPLAALRPPACRPPIVLPVEEVTVIGGAAAGDHVAARVFDLDDRLGGQQCAAGAAVG